MVSLPTGAQSPDRPKGPQKSVKGKKVVRDPSGSELSSPSLEGEDDDDIVELTAPEIDEGCEDGEGSVRGERQVGDAHSPDRQSESAEEVGDQGVKLVVW